jgi:hypothetical protein
VSAQQPYAVFSLFSKDGMDNGFGYTIKPLQLMIRRGIAYVDGMFFDITEQKRLEKQLRQAQKLESMGQMAEDIAHEVHAPTQHLDENRYFFQDTLI